MTRDEIEALLDQHGWAVKGERIWHGDRLVTHWHRPTLGKNGPPLASHPELMTVDDVGEIKVFRSTRHSLAHVISGKAPPA